MTSEVENSTPTEQAMETAIPATPAPPRISPGDLLRRAREAKGLSVNELAAQTRLARATLEALEKSDFGSSKPVFVRGYFRKCARVLNLSEEDLISAYASWTGTSLAPEPLAPTFTEPPKDYGDSRVVPGWKYAIGIAVVIGFALWWFGSGGHGTSGHAAGNNTTAMPDNPAVTSSTTDGESKTLTLQPPSNLNAPEPAKATAAPAAAAEPSTPAPTSGAPAPVAGQSDASKKQETASVPAGPNALAIKVERAASWVEVVDNDGKKLVYDLLQPGSHREVAGKPPYEIVLGNPAGLMLTMGGRPIDLKPYTAPGGTARLTLDKP